MQKQRNKKQLPHKQKRNNRRKKERNESNKTEKTMNVLCVCMGKRLQT